MNKLILVPTLFLFSLTACGQNPQRFIQSNSLEFSELIKKEKGTLLDVRTPSEFANGHIKSAGQLNYYAPDFKQKLLMLPKDQPIYLYCNTGYRSKIASEILVENGYNHVYNLQHGIMEWNLRNLPVVIEKNAKVDVDNSWMPDDFNVFIQSDSLVFIDFYAPWCAPCRKMMPLIDSLKVEYHNKINIVKINAEASKKLVKELKLLEVPYFVLYFKGELLFSKNGMITRKELTSLFDLNSKKYNN